MTYYAYKENVKGLEDLDVIATHTYIVSSEADMLSLPIRKGDIAIRTDINATFINTNGENGDLTLNWQEILASSGGGAGGSAGYMEVVDNTAMLALNVSLGNNVLVTSTGIHYKNITGQNSTLADWKEVVVATTLISGTEETSIGMGTLAKRAGTPYVDLSKGQLSVYVDGTTYKNLIVVTDFSISSSYKAGESVLYNGNIYTAKTNLSAGTFLEDNFDSHILRKDNPHSVTAIQVPYDTTTPGAGTNTVQGAIENIHATIGSAIRMLTVVIDPKIHTGTVEADINASDFSHYKTPGGTALTITPQDVIIFYDGTSSYNWVGPTAITVGQGGTHPVVASDLSQVHISEHVNLANRNSADQHTIAAITNLQAELNKSVSHIASRSNPHNVTWAQLPGKPGTMPPSAHTHDDRYYTKTESNNRYVAKPSSSYYITKVQGDSYYAPKSHSHGYLTQATADNRYYTRGVADGIFARIHSHPYSLSNHSHTWAQIKSKPHIHRITGSTAGPSGGVSGDLHIQY